MFYKIIKFTLLVAVLFCVILFLSIAMGWIGLNNVLFSFQSLLITIGIFSFYKSRPNSKKATVIKSINLIVHILSIPLSVVAAMCVKGESLALNYWYWVNLTLVIFLSINLLTIILNSGIKPFLKLVISALAFVFAILILLQMSGKFNEGKIVMYGAAFFLLSTILAVFFGANKKA